MHFMFKEEDNIVDCHVERLFKDVVEEFAKKVNEDLETIFFIYKGKKIDLSNYYNYVGQVFNLVFQKEKQRIDLLVFQENLFSIKFIYQGIEYIINAKLKEKMKIVFQKLEEKSEIILQNVIFQKSGDKFLAKEKEEIPVEQIANSYDKEENSMTILVYDLERNNSLANENLGRLLPQSEDNDSNYNNNNSINNNNSYENPKIYNDEAEKAKKYNEEDEENIQIKSRDDFISSSNNDKNKNRYDRDDDDRKYNNRESNNSFIERLLNSQNQREDNSNSNSNEEKSKGCNCSCFNKMRPIFLILIQFLLIISLFLLGYVTGLIKYLKSYYVFMGAQVFHILLALILYIYCFIFQKEFKSKWWYIFLIPFIPLIVIYCFYIFDNTNSDWQMIITFFLVMIFALLAALILRGKRPRLLIILLLLSCAIVLIPSILIFGPKKDNIGTLIGASLSIDLYVWLIYCITLGLFDPDDIIYSVAFFDYLFYLALACAVYYLGIYPFIYISKKCYNFCKNDG